MDWLIITGLDKIWEKGFASGRQTIASLYDKAACGYGTVRSAGVSESHTAGGLEGFGRSPQGLHVTGIASVGRTNVCEEIDSKLD
jgi:hypothetical protein